MQVLQSLTCSASARIQASRMAVPTQLLLTEGGAAMSTSLVRGQPVAVEFCSWQAPPGWSEC